MSSSAKFWDKIAKKYAARPVADEAVYEKKLETTRRYFTPDMQLLEVGCGTGTTAVKHAPHVAHIRAVDVSDNMLAIGRERAAEAGVSNITFECNTIDDTEMPSSAYDMVLALSILHLVRNWEAVIDRVFDTLKPGGLFVTSTACLKDGYGFMRPILPVMKLFGVAPDYVAFFSADELESAFRHAGFEVEHKWQPGPKKGVFMILKKPD